jgi:hypothetical protein
MGGDVRSMTAGRDQVRDSTRRLTAIGFCSQGSRFVKTSILLSPELACSPPMPRYSHALHCLCMVRRSITRYSSGHGCTNHDDRCSGGRAATKPFPRLTHRTLRRYAISSMLFLAILAALADNVRGASLIGTNLQGSFIKDVHIAPGIFPYLMRHAQMTVGGGAPIAYFLEQAPDDAQMSKLPQTAQEIVVAKVQVLGVPAYLGGRDQSGRPPAGAPPKHVLVAQLKVIDVRRGDATPGAILEVKFGVRDLTRTLVHHPHTPAQLGRDYFVVMLRDNGGEWSLVGFPITDAQYQSWETEFWDFERTRGRPGAPW